MLALLIATIVTSSVNAAQVLFLIALILFVIALVVGIAESAPRTRPAGSVVGLRYAWWLILAAFIFLTAGLLWSRNQPLLAPRIVPAAQRLPWLFATLVNHAAQA